MPKALKSSTAVRVGKPYREMIAFAKEKRADINPSVITASSQKRW